MDARGQVVGPAMYSGFPVRTLTKRLSGGRYHCLCRMSCEPCITEGSTSGEWITAYRAEQKRHLRAALSSCLYEAKSSNKRRTASRSPSGSKEGSQVLDTRFLVSK